MTNITTMKSEVCSKMNQTSLIVHSGSLTSIGSINSNRSHNCKVSKTISLQQEPEESAILDFSLSYSAGQKYNHYDSHNLHYRFELTFENNLHEISKDYGYEIEFYLCTSENGLSTHALLFSQAKMRETNKISIYYCSSNSLDLSSELVSKLRLITDNKRHMCCIIRRVNVKITEDIDKPLTQNTNVAAMLLETGLYSDVTFVVGEKSLPVHKHVLSAASRIFEAMFSHDMVENQQGKVIIEDFSPEVVEGLLSFIYTGKTSLISKMPLELFQIAHKYEIQTLKNQCMESLLFMLNFENVVNILYIACMYELTDLKSDILKFIKNHEEKLVNEKSFQEYLCQDLKIDTVVDTLKLCDKYKEILENVETEVFKFIINNSKTLAKNEEFTNLFETHSLLMKRLYVFEHQNN